MNTPEVSVVVVTYNSAEWIGRCLDAIPGAFAGRRAEIVIVDNDSVDGTAELVDERAPDVTLLRNRENRGFAAAVNAGAAASGAPWILLLNPDTVPGPGSLRNLLAFAEANPGHGLYGGRTLTVEGELEPSSCWGRPTLWSTFCFASGLSSFFPRSSLFDPESLGRWQRDTVREVGIVTGCLLLVDRVTWERLGGLDERYFVYGEDADFSARAHRLGLRPVITPDAEVVHAVGKSSDGASSSNFALVFAGKVTYARTHFPGVAAALAVSLLRCGVAWRALLEKSTGRGQHWSAGWRRRDEWWDGFASRTLGPASRWRGESEMRPESELMSSDVAGHVEGGSDGHA